MATTKKDGNGSHGYLGPVVWIIALMMCYWIILDWKLLPTLVSSAIATID